MTRFVDGGANVAVIHPGETGVDDVPVVDFLITDSAIAWGDPLSKAVHAHHVYGIKSDGDEWLVDIGEGRIVRISPLVDQSMLAIALQQRSQSVQDELKAMVAGLGDAPKPKSSTYRVAHLYGHNAATQLPYTAGVLVQGDGTIFAQGLAGTREAEKVNNWIEEVLALGGTPEGAFDHCVAKTSLYESYSKPFVIEAQSAGHAAGIAMNKLAD